MCNNRIKCLEIVIKVSEIYFFTKLFLYLNENLHQKG